MSVAIKLDENFDVVEVIDKIMAGEMVHCEPKNPFYDLDLSVLVALDQVKAYAQADPIALLGNREKSYRFQVRSLVEKQGTLEKVSEILDSHNVSRSLKEDSLLCADELITNSIFNAPFKEKKDRKITDLKIPGECPVLFDITIGENEFVISCVDPFGSLELVPFFERIRSCYQSGVGESINYGQGGAGIGCYLILEHCLSFVLGVVPGKRTSIYCRFPLKMSSKLRKSLPKNIIVFNREE